MAVSQCNAEPHSVYVSEGINQLQDPRWLLLSVMLFISGGTKSSSMLYQMSHTLIGPMAQCFAKNVKQHISVHLS